MHADPSLLAAAPGYGAVLVLLLVVIGMAAAMLILAHTLGPKRRGPVKDTPYESGMPPVADARRRFNVRFYLVALVFLLFDVEVVFFWPWGPLFHKAAVDNVTIGAFGTKGFLLVEMLVFLLILLVGYVYAWRKGVFKWD